MRQGYDEASAYDDGDDDEGEEEEGEEEDEEEGEEEDEGEGISRAIPAKGAYHSQSEEYRGYGVTRLFGGKHQIHKRALICSRLSAPEMLMVLLLCPMCLVFMYMV